MSHEADLVRLFKVPAPAEEKHSLMDWLLVKPQSLSDQEYILMDAIRCRESSARFGRRMTILTLVSDSSRIDQTTSNNSAFPRVSDSVEEYLSEADGLFDPIRVGQVVGTTTKLLDTGVQPEDESKKQEGPKITLSCSLIYFYRHHLATLEMYTAYRQRYVNTANRILEILGQQKFPPYDLTNAADLRL